MVNLNRHRVVTLTEYYIQDKKNILNLNFFLKIEITEFLATVNKKASRLVSTFKSYLFFHKLMKTSCTTSNDSASVSQFPLEVRDNGFGCRLDLMAAREKAGSSLDADSLGTDVPQLAVLCGIFGG